MERIECLQLINTKHPHSKVEWINNGVMNYVAIVDKRLVYKFPRLEKNRKILAYEAEVYDLFQDITSVRIPKTIELEQDNTYGVFTCVSGKFLSAHETSSLSKKNQLGLAKVLTEFIEEINTNTMRTAFKIIYEKYSKLLSEGEIKDWLEKVAKYAATNPNKHTSHYLKLYQQLNERFPSGYGDKVMITHNDLHNENMLFDENNKLIGIIDFGDMRFGSLTEELRTVYRFGETTTSELLKSLDSYNTGDDMAGLRLFSITYEYGVLIEESFMNKQKRKERLLIAADLLNKWGEV